MGSAEQIPKRSQTQTHTNLAEMVQVVDPKDFSGHQFLAAYKVQHLLTVYLVQHWLYGI